jgi:hypothetical protein
MFLDSRWRVLLMKFVFFFQQFPTEISMANVVVGRAMAKAVSRWLPTAAARVRARV